jgi:hypothetical protein
MKKIITLLLTLSMLGFTQSYASMQVASNNHCENMSLQNMQMVDKNIEHQNTKFDNCSNHCLSCNFSIISTNFLKTHITTSSVITNIFKNSYISHISRVKTPPPTV